jgi:GYD domain-containing protein
VTVKDVYRTMGRYDLAAIVDAPDDVTMSAILYSIGSLGNVRTETLQGVHAAGDRSGSLPRRIAATKASIVNGRRAFASPGDHCSARRRVSACQTGYRKETGP